jgi:hypothetical protein
VRLAIGIFLIIAGTIWVLQGFDVTFAPESFMTGDRWWVLWGGGALIAGALIISWHRRSS